MKVREAKARAKELNRTGKYKKDWEYFAEYAPFSKNKVNDYYILRKPKKSENPRYVVMFWNGDFTEDEY